MFSMGISIGRCIYYASFMAYQNSGTIMTIYSMYDTGKFTFYVIDRIGVVDYIKKKITPDKSCIILMRFVEVGDLGEFEIVEI
jgi:hypothetical protein